METTLRIRGMSCGHCVRAVEAALKKLPDVKQVRVTIGEAVVESDTPLDTSVLRDTIQGEGFELV